MSLNDRGQYGTRRATGSARGQYGHSTPFVGQGSIFGHSPSEVEDELDQLHSELMQFGQEVIEIIEKPAETRIQADPEVQRLRAEEKAAYAHADSLPKPPPIEEWMRQPQHMVQWRQEFDKRVEAVKKAREITDRRADYEKRLMSQPSALINWAHAVWDPFMRDWLKWRSEKKDIPFQLWPLSGVWDRIQEYRQKFIAIRKGAPFKTMTPEPLTPEGRKDPSLTGAARDIWGGIGGAASILKWTAIGALAIGGVIALASVATSWKKKEDPWRSCSRTRSAARGSARRRRCRRLAHWQRWRKARRESLLLHDTSSSRRSSSRRRRLVPATSSAPPASRSGCTSSARSSPPRVGPNPLALWRPPVLVPRLLRH